MIAGAFAVSVITGWHAATDKTDMALEQTSPWTIWESKVSQCLPYIEYPRSLNAISRLIGVREGRVARTNALKA